MSQGPDCASDEPQLAPLTGREPILGRLEARLSSGATGGWLAVEGPPGAGVSRLLEELARERPAPERALSPWIAPAEPGAGRFEALRRLLLPWWRRAGDAALSAALEPVLPPGAGAGRLLGWLGAGPLAAPALSPPAAAVKAAVGALAAGQMLIADDWLHLDPGTRRVLAELAAAGEVGVLAGVTREAPEAEPLPGPSWPLEPLAESQVELLLRRWLKLSVTARRLAPELAGRAQGWPGRVVALVHGLVRLGCLERSGRGYALRAWPRSWTALERVWMHTQTPADDGPAASRVHEAAALMTEPLEPDLLAEVAGVKRALVEAQLARAAAARHGRAVGLVHADAQARAARLERLPAPRRAQLGLRWAQVLSRIDPATDRGLGASLVRVEALLLAGRGLGFEAPLARALARALGGLAGLTQPPAPLLDLVERAVTRLASEGPDGGAAPPVLPEAAAWLAAHGRPGPAAELARSPAGALLAPRPLAEPADPWLRLAVLHAPAQARAEAERRLGAHLSGAPPQDPEAYAGWKALAQAPGLAPDEQRRRWRCVLDAVPSCDVAERAWLHRSLSRAAERRARLRAAAAHGRRAALLLAAAGDVAGAAEAHGEAGRLELALGRAARARGSLAAAARAWTDVGEPARAAEALEREAHACLALSGHDEAVPLLEAALHGFLEAGAPGRGAACHLALAAAHRSRGDLARERTHARAALRLAVEPGLQPVAHATWLVASVRSGEPGAAEELGALVESLERAGHARTARLARRALLDAHLRAGDLPGARRWSQPPAGDPSARLAEARLLRLTGRPEEAMGRLEALGRDAAVAVEHRAEAEARLAELQAALRDPEEAGRSAQAASALLEVPRRDHAEDPRLHRLLARVFRDVGARARSVEHRAAARRALRLPPLAEVGAEVRRRIARSLWMDDPRPASRRSPALAVGAALR